MAKKFVLISLAAVASVSLASVRPNKWIRVNQPLAQLEKFVDELPIPQSVSFQGRGPIDYTVHIQQISAKLHRDLPAQSVWAYNGSSPGPTLELKKNQQLRVHWKNELPLQHLFPEPKGMNPVCLVRPDVRTVTHLHGAIVSEYDPLNRQRNNDGWPDAWVGQGNEQIAEYTNPQSARTLWYHDHAMGATGRNVAAGLIGAYLIHDGFEKGLGLPSGKYDIPLLLQSRGVNEGGSLFYSDDLANEFYGNAMSINGKLWPKLKVEPRKYRFRLINASNARSYAMRLMTANGQAMGPLFNQIGSDSGFLEKPVRFNDPSDPDTDRLTIAPGERADIIIDFANFAGQKLVLQNNSKDPGEVQVELAELMQFEVEPTLSAQDSSLIPVQLQAIEKIPETSAQATRLIVAGDTKLADGTWILSLNGKTWNDPITEKPVLGSTEIWQLANTLTDVHPFHLHQTEFQVLDRRVFDVLEYRKSGKIIYLGDAIPPEANELAWKDTVKMYPQMVTRIITKFGPYPGFYLYHCHILEHEDMDMMRPFQIIDRP